MAGLPSGLAGRGAQQTATGARGRPAFGGNGWRSQASDPVARSRREPSAAHVRRREEDAGTRKGAIFSPGDSRLWVGTHSI